MMAKIRTILSRKNVLTSVLIAVLLVIVCWVTFSKEPIQTDNVNMNIPKNGEFIEAENMSVMYESTTVEDPDLEYGKTSIRSFGLNGYKVVTYNVIYEGGKEISRKIIREEVTKAPQNEVITKGTKIVWHCVDATSYDKNPYNDNKCTNSIGEIEYVSDSRSIQLDPTYSPGKSGASYYNNK